MIRGQCSPSIQNPKLIIAAQPLPLPLPGDVSANVLDFSKIHNATGWQPTVSLDEGLQRTCAWMKEKL